MIKILCIALPFFFHSIHSRSVFDSAFRKGFGVILLTLKSSPLGEFNMPAAFQWTSYHFPFFVSLYCSLEIIFSFSLFVPFVFPTSLCLSALYDVLIQLFFLFIKRMKVGNTNKLCSVVILHIYSGFNYVYYMHSMITSWIINNFMLSKRILMCLPNIGWTI